MSVLVVAAHPCAESYSQALCDRVLAGLASSGRRATPIDLYAAGYDPQLPFPSADTGVLREATALVLVHPTWWTSQPAILLAWLDQASAIGLPSVRSVVSVTTHGGSRLANYIGGESGKRVVDRAFRHRCELRPPHRRLALYGLDRAAPEVRLAFLDKVERRIGTLVAQQSRITSKVRHVHSRIH